MSFTFKMLTLLHKRMLCAKFGRNRPSCSGKEEFLIFGNFFSYLKGAWPFSFTSLSYFYLSARIQIEEVLNLVHCSIIAINTFCACT